MTHDIADAICPKRRTKKKEYPEGCTIKEYRTGDEQTWDEKKKKNAT